METEERFYSNGTTKVIRHTLHKEGFRDIHIRKIHGVWEMLAYTDSRMNDRWVALNMNEETILNNILLYGV